MARLRDGLVVEDEGTGVRHLWRVLDTNDDPGRPPTAEEIEQTRGVGGPPPRTWGLLKTWEPDPRRRVV